MDLPIRLGIVGTQSDVAFNMFVWSDNMGADGAEGGNLRAAKGLVMRECPQKKMPGQSEGCALGAKCSGNVVVYNGGKKKKTAPQPD